MQHISNLDHKRTVLLECLESTGLRFLLEAIAHSSEKAFGPTGASEFQSVHFQARMQVVIRQEVKGWLEDKPEDRLEFETGWPIAHLRELGILAGWFSDQKDETGVMKAVAKKLWDRLLSEVEMAIINPANAIVVHPEIIHVKEIQETIVRMRNQKSVQEWGPETMKVFQEAEVELEKIGLNNISWSQDNMKKFIINEAKTSEYQREIVRDTITEIQKWLEEEELERTKTTLTTHVFHELKRKRVCRRLEKMGFTHMSKLRTLMIEMTGNLTKSI